MKVIFHYVNWCGYCKKMQPVWAQIKSKIPNVTFVEVDEDRANTPYVRAYPTIVAELNGKRYTYNGGIEYTALHKWVTSLAY